MKKLKLFEHFDYVSFFKDKKLVLVSMTQKHTDFFNGVVAELVIVEDHTDYDGETGCNNYEKFTFKIPNVPDDYVKGFKLNHVVQISEVYKAKLWSHKDSYQVSLSIEGRLAQ